MKYVAWFMVLLVIIAFGAIGYVYFTAQVSVLKSEAVAVLASEQEALFSQIKEDVEKQRFKGTMLLSSTAEKAEIEKSEDYAFITYSLTLKNQTFLLADTVEIQVVPNESDILQLGQEKNIRVAKRSEGKISTTILTTKDAYIARELVVTYYLWGFPFTLRTTVNPQ